MKTSQGTTPTMPVKPGMSKRADDKMEVLLEQKMVLDEAIFHYKTKIALDDFWKDWYINALTSYQKKQDKVIREICSVTGDTYESVKAGQTKATPEPIGEDTTATTQEASEQADAQAIERLAASLPEEAGLVDTKTGQSKRNRQNNG